MPFKTPRVAWLLAALFVAGCAAPPRSVPPSAPPSAPADVPPAARPPAVPTLVEEQRRLAKLLDGTPVVVEMTADGRLRVEVPLEHSFDSGRAVVKPALAKVLDLMSRGLKPQSTEVRVAAPSDPNGSSMLATDRAASTRDYLVARGVVPLRFVSVGRGEKAGVEIVVSERFTPAR
jgi:outer membrane protein OmpA-like peptidoglycan-associated protein